jgi:hypothetical protein
VIPSNEVYFRNTEYTPWMDGLFPAGAVGSFRLPWVAVVRPLFAAAVSRDFTRCREPRVVNRKRKD